MDLLDSFIITQKSAAYLAGIIILFSGALFNFAICGLFGKNSQKISNYITVLTLLSSSAAFLPPLIGFLNPHGIKALSYFNSSILLNSADIQYCLITNLAVFTAFIISLKHLKRLRHKAHYFNTLYLTAAFGANTALLSSNVLIFILSLEIISISTAFIISGYKNKKILFLTLKYILFSAFASAVMLFACALSSCFSIQDGILLSVSKIIFISGLLLKCGFFTFFAQQREAKGCNFPSFVFVNTFVLSFYSLALLKTCQNLLQIGSIVQWLFIIAFMLFSLICALKILRAKDFQTFILQINSLNFSILALTFFILTQEANTAGIFMLINILIAISAILSAHAIFSYNHSGKVLLDDYKGICLTNPAYCAALSAGLFIIAGVLPSGVLCSRFYTAVQILKTGIWSSAVLFVVVISYTTALFAITNFIITIHKKPSCVKELKEIALKKRTKLNYFILFASLILSAVLCFFSSKIIGLITSFQQIPALY